MGLLRRKRRRHRRLTGGERTAGRWRGEREWSKTEKDLEVAVDCSTVGGRNGRRIDGGFGDLGI